MSFMYSPSSRIHFEFVQSCDNSYIFNLTNVGLSMYVMEYSDLFLNLIWTDPDIFVWKKYEIIPAWRGKVGIILICMVGESCDDPCTGLSHTRRKVWSSFAILELIRHFYCVTVIKHSTSLKKNRKLHTNLKMRKICERDLLKYW